jgi:hypothetical protein
MLPKVQRSRTGGTHARCSRCGRLTPNYDLMLSSPAGSEPRPLCNHCNHSDVALEQGLHRFEHVSFEPVRVSDSDGQQHEFHFRVRLFGPGVALDAFELRDGCPAGYQFQAIGEPEGDLLALLGQLIAKIRRALAVRHIEDGPHGPSIAERRVVRGRIGWDPEQNGQVPLLVVDGREITWDDLGRMLMTFEGSQFKLEIRDKSEEV